MKKLKTILSLFIIALTINACNEQTDVSPVELKFVEVAIPDAYKTNPNSLTSSDDVDDLVLDVQITTTDGKVIVGKVHFVMHNMHNDETLSYFAMTENLLVETGLSADYWVEALSSTTNERIARTQGCFAACREMKKGEGRGTCRAECWLGIAVKIAAIVAVIAAL